MALQNYKTGVILDVVFILFGPFLQIINIDRLIWLMIIFKSPF